MKQKLGDERKSEFHKDAQAFVLVALSHGEEGFITCSDGGNLEIDYITSCFGKARCPHLEGKPKIFIIQACQEGNV